MFAYFRVRAHKQSCGRFVLHKNDSIAARNVMVLKGHISLMLQCCRDSVWMEGVWKKDERRSGTSPSLRLWPSKSHALIEYRTNASIYYLNMLHYHYASLSQSLSKSRIYTLKNRTRRHAEMLWCLSVQLLVCACTLQVWEIETERKKEWESMTQKSLSLWVTVLSPSLCSVLCVKRFGGDNTETSWTRARSTHARHRWHLLIHAHSAGNLVHSSKWEETRDCWRQGR